MHEKDPRDIAEKAEQFLAESAICGSLVVLVSNSKTRLLTSVSFVKIILSYSFTQSKDRTTIEG